MFLPPEEQFTKYVPEEILNACRRFMLEIYPSVIKGSPTTWRQREAVERRALGFGWHTEAYLVKDHFGVKGTVLYVKLGCGDSGETSGGIVVDVDDAVEYIWQTRRAQLELAVQERAELTAMIDALRHEMEIEPRTTCPTAWERLTEDSPSV